MDFGRDGRDFNSIFAEPRMSNPFLEQYPFMLNRAPARNRTFEGPAEKQAAWELLVDKAYQEIIKKHPIGSMTEYRKRDDELFNEAVDASHANWDAKDADMMRARKEEPAVTEGLNITEQQGLGGAVPDAQEFMAPTRPYDERAFESKLIDNRLEEALKKLLGHGKPKY